MTRYRIERYRAEHLNQVCQVEEEFWGPSRDRAAAFLDWKYARNPYTEGTLLYVALCEGRVVGVRGMFGTCWTMGGGSGGRYVLPSASDFMIRPEHRNSGLFHELTAYPMDDVCSLGYSHVLNLSPSPANFVASVTVLGWRSIGSAGLVARRKPKNKVVSSIKSVASRLNTLKKLDRACHRAVADLGINAFRHLDRAARRHAGESRFPVTLEKAPRAEAMTELAQRLIGAEKKFQHVQDEEYFSWRFGSPLSQYRFLYWEKGTKDDIDGYLVLHNRRGQPQVNIVDWQGSNPEIRSRLFQAALDWGQFRSCSTSCGTLPEEDVTVLNDAGFTPDTQNGHGGGGSAARSGRLLVRPVRLPADDEAWSLEGSRLDSISNWHYRLIWGDNY